MNEITVLCLVVPGKLAKRLPQYEAPLYTELLKSCFFWRISQDQVSAYSSCTINCLTMRSEFSEPYCIMHAQCSSPSDPARSKNHGGILAKSYRNSKHLATSRQHFAKILKDLRIFLQGSC